MAKRSSSSSSAQERRADPCPEQPRQLSPDDPLAIAIAKAFEGDGNDEALRLAEEWRSMPKSAGAQALTSLNRQAPTSNLTSRRFRCIVSAGLLL